jgi:hypothetical protein
MMTKRNKGRWWLLIGALGAVSCSGSNPEDFCASRVVEICQALSGCCAGTAEFDQDGCELEVSESCENAIPIERVHSGEYVFDGGSASICFGSTTTCQEATSAAPPSIDRVRACGNMITGHRPAGAVCQISAECEKAGGDYPVCYHDRICAKAILSEDKCGFSFDTNELHVCAPGKYCDVPEATPDPNEPPTSQQLEFSGTCNPPAGEGEKCFPNGEPIPCQEGLYCQLDSLTFESSVCAPRKGKGETCDGGDFECLAGLHCGFDETGLVCTEEGGLSSLFCFEPVQCGNGICEPQTESNQTCPQDCNNCGNGICDFNDGEPAGCPADCCGDGFCDVGETPQVCPIDC